jgi:hypothetical protein
MRLDVIPGPPLAHPLGHVVGALDDHVDLRLRGQHHERREQLVAGDVPADGRVADPVSWPPSPTRPHGRTIPALEFAAIGADAQSPSRRLPGRGSLGRRSRARRKSTRRWPPGPPRSPRIRGSDRAHRRTQGTGSTPAAPHLRARSFRGPSRRRIRFVVDRLHGVLEGAHGDPGVPGRRLRTGVAGQLLDGPEVTGGVEGGGQGRVA